HSLYNATPSPSIKSSHSDRFIFRASQIALAYGEYFFGFFKKLPPTPVIFLIARLERTVKVEGKYFSRFSNSLQEMLKGVAIKSVTLDLSRKKQPIWGTTTFIDRQLLVLPLKSTVAKVWRRIFGSTQKIGGWPEFEKKLKAKFPQIQLDYRKILKESQSIVDYRYGFIRVLRQLKPKICFMEC